MALFGNLFEKKNCAICDKELGVFGKTKISEGYLCKDCSGKLSPYFHGYRSATAEDIRAQLSYREANKADVASFHVTRTLGSNTKVYVDEDQGKVIITTSQPSNWGTTNPDVLDFSQITGCDYNVKETKTEIKRKDAEGKEVSYNPPRYDIDYDIYVTVYVSHPYVGQIEFKANQNRIETRNSAEFRQAEQTALDIKSALTGIRAEQRAAALPKTPVTCPSCLATSVPDETGCCPYCGTSLASVIAELQGASGQAAREDEPAYDDRSARDSRGYDRYGSSARDYGERDYGERDYGEGQDQRTRSQGSATSTKPRVTGQAKADFRRANR